MFIFGLTQCSKDAGSARGSQRCETTGSNNLDRCCQEASIEHVEGREESCRSLDRSYARRWVVVLLTLDVATVETIHFSDHVSSCASGHQRGEGRTHNSYLVDRNTKLMDQQGAGVDPKTVLRGCRVYCNSE
jgi:hypothetical protein